MTNYQAVERVVDLLDPSKNVLFNRTTEVARALLAEGGAEAVRQFEGQFALVATRGQRMLLALESWNYENATLFSCGSRTMRV